MYSYEIQKGEYSRLIPNQYIIMPDGARWRQFEIDNGVLVLTSSGLELFRGKNARSIVHALRSYRQDVIGSRKNGSSRKYLANGSNGEVYSLFGCELVVKESRSIHSLYYALYRMDTLSRIVESYFPHWVSVVPHYGLVASRNPDREYMLMKKINGGVTIEDFMQYSKSGKARSKELTRLIQKEFQYFDLSCLKSQYEELQKRMEIFIQSDEARKNGYTHNSLFPDMNYGNVLVEPLKTPIGGKLYKMWIIDQ